MNKTSTVATFAAVLFAATTAMAQGAGGAGGGTGTGPGGPSPSTGAAASKGGQTGSSMGNAPSFNESNTPGWGSMSASERTQHQQRMQSFKNYNDCSSYMGQMRSRSGAGTGGSGTTAATGTQTQQNTTPMPSAGGAGADPCGHLPRS